MKQPTSVISIPYEVELIVKSVKGTCAFGHKVGDRIYFNGKTIKGDICYHALMTMLPKVYARINEAEYSWAKNPDIIYNACPDPFNPVVFEIRRIPTEKAWWDEKAPIFWRPVSVRLTPEDFEVLKKIAPKGNVKRLIQETVDKLVQRGRAAT